jgi:hypothetical protein
LGLVWSDLDRDGGVPRFRRPAGGGALDQGPDTVGLVLAEGLDDAAGKPGRVVPSHHRAKRPEDLVQRSEPLTRVAADV